MKRILKKGKVKGSVLFTTTGVMLVLVVFLMSTMVLASSANRRSYYTYYETQAQYAAQAALDAITNSAYSDANFHQWITTQVVEDPITHVSARLPVTVDFTNSNIQFTNDADTVTCFIERADSNYIWDDVTQAVHEQRAWKITATASVGNGKNASEYSVSNYLYENFHVDDPATLNTVQNVGHNTTFNYSDGAPGGPGTLPTSGSGTLVPAILSLSASGTNNNFISLGPQYSNLSTLPRGRTRYENAPADYLVDTSNNNYAVGNILYFNNLHSSVLRNCTFQKFGESAIYYGDLYNENAGDVAGFRWWASISDAEVARMGGSIPYTALPYVYVDGKLYANDHNGAQGGGFYVGYTTNIQPGNYPVNLFCGAVNASAANTDFAVLGDAYLYDPALDSVICSGRLENDSALKAFAINNVQRANTQLANQTIGGNLYCNNRSLTLGEGKPMTIDGDLVFTNKQGTLNFTNSVHVKGRVICDGTIQNAGNLTADLGIFTGTDAASYYDGLYSTYVTDSGYNSRADGTPLLPYAFRLDEMFTKYYRWDLAAGAHADAQANAQNDSLVAESVATGHTWEVKEFVIRQDEVQYEIITDTSDPRWNWGAAYYDQSLGTNAMKVQNGIITTTTPYYVPFTTPRSGNAFIPGYEPISPDTAMSAQTQTNTLNFESVAAFDTLLGSSAPYYDQSNTPQQVSVPVVYHDSLGNEQSASLDNAYVINQSCTIDLNAGYNNANIFIDPRYGNHSQSSPLVIKFVGHKTANNWGQIVINNTASYNPQYTDYTSYASQSVYAGRREVFIFFDNGFGSMSGPFKLYTSGAYEQFNNNSWRVVSNPIYPGQAGFDTLAASIKYAYELVPNVAIFGEANGEYFFDNGAMINADILMPNATIHNGNASNYEAAVEYREYSDSIPYSASSTSMVGVGSAMVRIYDTGTNIAQTAYIGDEGRGTPGDPGTPSLVTVEDITDVNSGYLGQEYQDHFSNHHRGT